MNEVESKQNHETDTVPAVPAPTETAPCEVQSVSPLIGHASDADNQKPAVSHPSMGQERPKLYKMKMTSWGFELPEYAGSKNTVASEVYGTRLTKEEFLARMNADPTQQPFEKELQNQSETTAAPLPALVPATVVATLHDNSLKVALPKNASPVESKSPSPPLPAVAPDWLPQCPLPGGGRNAWCFSAALACLRNGRSAEEAAALIKDNLSREPRVGEIERAVRNAYLEEPHEKRQPSVTSRYNEAELRALAYKAQNWSVDNLKNASPINVSDCTSIQYLRHIFRTGEHVILTTSLNDRGKVWLNDPKDPTSREDELDSFKEPTEGKGAWFLSNPVNGSFIQSERLKSDVNPDGMSLRAEENLTSFKYLVVESDEAPQDLWLSALVQLPLPIVSIVNSGGKSLHALVRVDAVNGDHWRAIKHRIAPALVTLGADKSALTAVRLTRLPGSYRTEKGQWQKLLYLNPDANETPICLLPTRN